MGQKGYLEAALSCTCHCLQPARHTPAFPVLQSPCRSGRGQSLGLLVRRWPHLDLHASSVTLVVSSSLQPPGL